MGQGGLSGWHDQALVTESGIVIGRKGTVGSVIYSKEHFWPIDTTFYVTAKHDQDLKFTYYLLKTLKLEKMNADSAVPGLNRDEAHSLCFLLPPLPEQKRIAHILGTLDDKIELNRQMNQTLEAMAQAMFKSWFVDFDPVIDNALEAGNPIPDELQHRASLRAQLHQAGKAKQLPEDVKALFPSGFVMSEEMGWVPEGWEVGRTGDLFELHRGFDLPAQNRQVGEFSIYSAGGIHGVHNCYKMEPPGVITGRSGVIGKVHLSLERYWPLNTTLYVRKFKHCDAFYSFYYLKTLDLASFNSGSAVPSLNRNIIHSLPTLLPNDHILKKYEVIASNNFIKIGSLEKENCLLAKLRDTLLPKLISGELRIPEAEAQIKEALI